MKHDKLVFLKNIGILLFTAVIICIYISKTGDYPWGSDTFGHLFKGNILYDSIKKGNLYLNYNESWYNGVQPYRYWAPLPYYILAIINLFTNNIFTTFEIFVGFIFALGGLGWLCWGYYTHRQNYSLILAILWFFVPNNLRILFSEGNLPYVIVNSLVPFILLYYYKSLQKKEIKNYIILAVFMGIATLSHAMLAAMVGIALFIFALIDTIINRRILKNILSLIFAFCGVMTTSFWLYPALKGGLMSMNQGAVAEVMKNLTYPLGTSLNPLLRFGFKDIYYYGLAFAIVAAFGMVLSTKNERASFVSALIILIGTTKMALPILQKLPMNQLFWMSRFTSISMALIIMGLLLWKRLRKSVSVILILLLVIDSAASFYVLGFNNNYPSELSSTMNDAAKIATQRVGVLDLSEYGSFPSYYIPYNKVDGNTNQVYGWAWQGATTAKNIVMINTALERGYYGVMFDRSLELGADTLIIKKNLIKDSGELQKAAATIGYQKYKEDLSSIIYKYPSVGQFGTSVNYDGIAIGAYSDNIVYLFPNFQSDYKEYLDDYTYDELKDKKAIFLSGFKYKNKDKAEKLILKLSENNVKILVDITGLDESFLGVQAESITLNDNYGKLVYKKDKLETENFPEDNKKWVTYFVNGIKNEESYEVNNNRLISYIGTKYNSNLTFVGLNVPYYTFLTKNSQTLKILSEALNMQPGITPKRDIKPIAVNYTNNSIRIVSDSKNIIVPLAALDAFKKVKGDYKIEDNLICLKTNELQIDIGYPYAVTGIIISVVFSILIICMALYVRKKELEKEERSRKNEL